MDGDRKCGVRTNKGVRVSVSHERSVYLSPTADPLPVSTGSVSRSRSTATEANSAVAGLAGIVETITFGGLRMLMGGAAVVAGAFPALYFLGPSLTAG